MLRQRAIVVAVVAATLGSCKLYNPFHHSKSDGSEATPSSESSVIYVKTQERRVTRDLYSDQTSTDRIDYQYDEKGRVTNTRTDSGDNGSYDSTERYTYNAQGLPATYEQDQNADGVPDYVETTLFNENGQKSGSETDSNGDGVVDRRVLYKFDTSGGLDQIDTDNDADGVIDSVWTITGSVALGSVDTVFDDLTPANSDWSIHTEYNASGDRVREDHILNNSYIDKIRYEYFYNSKALLELQQVDLGIDGTIDARGAYSYDAQDRLTTEALDLNTDGAIDQYVTWEYTETGLLQSIATDTDADGNAEIRHVYEYDENGNLIQLTSDYDGDGRPEVTVTYTWSAIVVPGTLPPDIPRVLPPPLPPPSFPPPPPKLN